MPARHRMTLEQYRIWRHEHYWDGTPRPADDSSFLLDALLSTRRGAIAVRNADRRRAKQERPQHTASPNADADYLHHAYGTRHGHR